MVGTQRGDRDSQSFSCGPTSLRVPFVEQQFGKYAQNLADQDSIRPLSFLGQSECAVEERLGFVIGSLAGEETGKSQGGSRTG